MTLLWVWVFTGARHDLSDSWLIIFPFAPTLLSGSCNFFFLFLICHVKSTFFNVFLITDYSTLLFLLLFWLILISYSFFFLFLFNIPIPSTLASYFYASNFLTTSCSHSFLISLLFYFLPPIPFFNYSYSFSTSHLFFLFYNSFQPHLSFSFLNIFPCAFLHYHNPVNSCFHALHFTSLAVVFLL